MKQVALMILACAVVAVYYSTLLNHVPLSASSDCQPVNRLGREVTVTFADEADISTGIDEPTAAETTTVHNLSSLSQQELQHPVNVVEKNEYILDLWRKAFRETSEKLKRQILVQSHATGSHEQFKLFDSFHDCHLLAEKHNAGKVLRVLSLNIWNSLIMWEERKKRLVSAIELAAPDVIGFQEVNAHFPELYRELEMLGYAHSLFSSGLTNPSRLEGVGIVSKHPLLLHQELSLLPSPDSSDRNVRDVLRSRIQLSPAFSVDLLVAHLSYDAGQQCSNFVDLWQFVQNHGKHTSAAAATILLGDLNTYFDWEWGPLQFTAAIQDLPNLNSILENGCRSSFLQLNTTNWSPFKDVWLETHAGSSSLGSTFPTFVWGERVRDPARTDRMLLQSRRAFAKDSTLFGCERWVVEGVEYHLSDHYGILADIAFGNLSLHYTQ